MRATVQRPVRDAHGWVLLSKCLTLLTNPYSFTHSLHLARWWVFAIIDCVLGVTMFVNGALMVTSIASSPITVGDVSFLTTFCLGLYFCVFSVLSLISSFIWFTCLGKFIGFFYFMWGRGAFYLIFGTMSLTWPFACFDIEGG